MKLFASKSSPQDYGFDSRRALCDDQGDVVVLFVGGEGADVSDYGSEQGLGRMMAVAAEGFDQAIFAEFFVGVVHGFGYAVGVQG